jgi:hypothetical protein
VTIANVGVSEKCIVCVKALGMFMSCLTISSEGKPVRRVCKSAMLGKENSKHSLQIHIADNSVADP